MINRFPSFRPVGLYAVALIVIACFPSAAHAAKITKGDATKELGNNLFVDDASIGGDDAQAEEPKAVLSRNDFGALKVGTGGSRIEITGVAWASPNNAANNSAETVEVRVVYLGRDGVGGGGDDVVIGSVEAEFKYTGAGEYVFRFDEPISAVVGGKNAFFRIDIKPKNAEGTGKLRVKTSEKIPKVSVAGTTTAVTE